MDDFTHVIREEGETVLHFSHLFRYVSAYEISGKLQKQLREDILRALEIAKKECKGQVVDQDGEMFFVVHPSGLISLCLKWKSYKIKEG